MPFFEMNPCWCLSETARAPTSVKDQLERLAGILREAFPLYKERNKFSHNPQYAGIHQPVKGGYIVDN